MYCFERYKKKVLHGAEVLSRAGRPFIFFPPIGFFRNSTGSDNIAVQLTPRPAKVRSVLDKVERKTLW